jgi:predicted DNA-binding transcriptional regulator YafY
MSKVSNCIRLLEILNTGKTYKIAELSELLETNPRNIIEYKKELENAGYYINSSRGRYGGYFLEQESILPIITLDADGLTSYQQGVNYLLSRSDFVNKNSFIKSSGKILSMLRKQKFMNAVTVIDRFPLAMPQLEIQIRYNLISYSIDNRTTIKMTYRSLKNIEKKYLVNPYKLFMYNNAWFFLAWDTKRNDVLYFKINRIINLNLTDKNFEVYKYFDEKQYLDDFGMKNNGEWIKIRLKVKNQYAALIKERLYGKNQSIEEIDDKTSILTVDMQNEDAIITFVLGFGDNATLLEPLEIIRKLIDKINKMKNDYET